MFFLTVVTPEKTIFEGNVISVIAPGTVGYLELLTHHAPLITSLEPGKLTITDQNKSKKVFAISGGLLEMNTHETTILGDAIEAPEEINYHRAEEAFKRALDRIASKDPSIDVPRAKKALKRAANRIALYREFKAISAPSPLLTSFE
jgi:F-type H+-transporting ATPase subunit epsilon